MLQLDGQMRKSPNGLAHTYQSKKGKYLTQISNKLLLNLYVHTFSFRLELVTGALQKYRNVVRQKNVIKYDPIYPIISNYLENVYKNL